MELLNDDVFKPFEEDEISNLESIRGGMKKAEKTGGAAWSNGSETIVCQEDAAVNGAVVAGFDCTTI